jgi:hypothetical protein
MEWLDGVDMEQHLEALEESGERLSIVDLLDILQPVLDTLGKAHELGIVHRDIKPANIFLLQGGGGVRLLDFGLSRLKSSATLTAAGMVMGSPSYMAPEAWKGDSKAIGKQADLYSLAVIVYRALTGRLPFDTESLVEKMRMVTAGKRPGARVHRPDLPLVVDTWLGRALAIEPARRFQYASHFLEALVAALAGLPLPEHTLPQGKLATSIPPPRTTEAERENAVSAALGRATSLLKRFAASFSKAPKPAAANSPGDGSEPTPGQAAPSSKAAERPAAVRRRRPRKARPVFDPVHQHARRIAQLDPFAAGAQIADPRAEGRGAESCFDDRRILRHHQIAARGEDRARGKGEVHRVRQAPSGNIQIFLPGMMQLDEFLRHRRVGRIVVNLVDHGGLLSENHGKNRQRGKQHRREKRRQLLESGWEKRGHQLGMAHKLTPRDRNSSVRTANIRPNEFRTDGFFRTIRC